MNKYDSLLSELLNEVHIFRQWSESINIENYNWEDEYPNWPNATRIFFKVLEEVSLSLWTDEVFSHMLYILARDHEGENLATELVKYPQHLILLGKYGFNFPDYKARWQLCHYLSYVCKLDTEAESIILQYVQQDPDEYVRRRALLSLGYIKSQYAEEYALKAWNSKNEYQMIAAMQVLHDIDSVFFNFVLEEAANSVFENVRSRANYIKELRR